MPDGIERDLPRSRRKFSAILCAESNKVFLPRTLEMWKSATGVPRSSRGVGRDIRHSTRHARATQTPGSLYDLLHVAQKPSIDLRQIVDLVDRHSVLKGLSNKENALGVRHGELQTQCLSIYLFVISVSN